MSTDRYKPSPAAPWPKCTRCGLEAPDVAGAPAVCPDERRCERVKQLPRPQLELYPPYLLALAPTVAWEELELGRVGRA